MNFTNTTIGLASDHTGFEFKEFIKKHLEQRGLSYIDVGAGSTERSDYTDYAHLLGEAIKNKEIEIGIALCGTGNGMAMTLNKYTFIRAGLAWNVNIAKLISAHNKANILVIPARFITQDDVAQIVDAYLDTPFEGGRHLERIHKITTDFL
ncbi:MAG: RpiB/LacA/LacB family sugar-phosphate isomerase [Tannerella sp.]|jgi:ribose 5-phosphate isomerase B|nr:RpiB/LacA/LacB family sugar-phosphate isomerase [Tannerella sp.]